MDRASLASIFGSSIRVLILPVVGTSTASWNLPCDILAALPSPAGVRFLALPCLASDASSVGFLGIPSMKKWSSSCSQPMEIHLSTSALPCPFGQ